MFVNNRVKDIRFSFQGLNRRMETKFRKVLQRKPVLYQNRVLSRLQSPTSPHPKMKVRVSTTIYVRDRGTLYPERYHGVLYYRPKKALFIKFSVNLSCKFSLLRCQKNIGLVVMETLWEKPCSLSDLGLRFRSPKCVPHLQSYTSSNPW